jgi:hypothetical protein
MSVSDNKQPSAEEQMANLLAVMEKLVSVVATIQGNQGQLTIAFNRLQSEKLAATLGDKPTSASATASASTNSDATIHTLNHRGSSPSSSTSALGRRYRAIHLAS